MNRKNLSKWKQNVFRVTLSKKILLGFVLAAAISIAAFHFLRMIYAVLVVFVLAVVIYVIFYGCDN